MAFSFPSEQIGEQLEALYNQYDAEDFELGIKQFMIEQAIQQVKVEICYMRLYFGKYKAWDVMRCPSCAHSGFRRWPG